MLCDDLDGWDEAGSDRKVQEGGDTGIHIAVTSSYSRD